MSAAPLKVSTMLAEYPVTAPLVRGDVRSTSVVLDRADVSVASSAFKRVVRGMEFDCAELAIVTYLIAQAHGKPLVLLPAVIVGRFQHPYIVYNSQRGLLRPEDLNGKKVAIRSYSVTTSAWLRGILANDHGVDLNKVTWVTLEEAHVAEFHDPPTVQRAAAGKHIVGMLLSGEVDAAVVGDRLPNDPRLKTLIPDPVAAGAVWHKKYNAIQINHMVVVKNSLSRSNPEAVREIYRMLKESKRMSGLPAAGEMDMNPFGVTANRRNLEVAIDYVHQQGLIPRKFTVDELFDDVTRTLD
ncbi:MAG: ABC transporter substrate-binding protein [Burkholderiales bacterium]